MVTISGLTPRQIGAIIQAMPDEISDYTVQISEHTRQVMFRMDDPLGLINERIHVLDKRDRGPYLAVIRKVKAEMESNRG